MAPPICHPEDVALAVAIAHAVAMAHAVATAAAATSRKGM